MDLTEAKAQFARDMIYVSRLTLQLADKLHSLSLAFSGDGFNSGGTNEFVDADFDGTSNAHLSVAAVEDAMFVIGTADTLIGQAQRQALLRVIPGGQP